MTLHCPHRLASTLLPLVFAAVACFNIEVIDLGGDTDTSDTGTEDTGTEDTGTEDTETEDTELPPMSGLELLFVVDNSGSMSVEQQVLATYTHVLINALTAPSTSVSYEPFDDVRVAVISTDMGVSANGEIPPNELVPASLQPYLNFGDDGAFLETSVYAVDVLPGTIPCNGIDGQCPSAWYCGEDLMCTNTDGVSHEVSCPNPDESVAETSPDLPNATLGTEAACLTVAGTTGCGWEQHFASMARAFTRQDQEAFFRKNAALAVLVVSDEDDCSMADAVGLFATDEAVDQTKLNIACGENPEFLHTAEQYKDALVALKGSEERVFFAAIVGVPPTETCQGSGSEIELCLEDPQMAMKPYLDLSETPEIWRYTPACERYDGETLVTSAVPGRRFVELAQSMGERGYVSSICDASWLDAMESFAAIVANYSEDPYP